MRLWLQSLPVLARFEAWLDTPALRQPTDRLRGVLDHGFMLPAAIGSLGALGQRCDALALCALGVLVPADRLLERPDVTLQVERDTGSQATSSTSKVQTLNIAGGSTPAATLDLGNNRLVIGKQDADRRGRHVLFSR